jgi:hypothetical protein
MFYRSAVILNYDTLGMNMPSLPQEIATTICHDRKLLFANYEILK